MGYTISVSFIGNFVYMMKILLKYYIRKKELLNFKGSHADKTGFHRLGHIGLPLFFFDIRTGKEVRFLREK